MNKEISQAYAILHSIYVDGAYSSIELNTALNNADCNKALLTKLVYGVIEKDVTLQYIIGKFVSKMPSVDVLVILKLGTYMTRYLDSVPDYTIVNELVNITKRKNTHLSGFVNATLKKICSSKVPLPRPDTKEYISVKYSIPMWLVDKVIAEHDMQFAVSLFSHKLTDMTHIRVRGSVDSFVSALDKYKISYTPSCLPYTMYVDYAKLLNATELKNRYVVQGLPSILACVALMQDSGHKHVLDMCSAPGGKSCFIAENYDCNVTSCDIHAHRLELVKKYARSLELTNMEYVLADALVTNENFVNKYDCVLVDVPCSNLGLIQKKPDVLLNRKESDIANIADIQYRILDTASKYVKSGGCMVYSTCTILREENIDVVNKFLANHSDYAVEKINTTIDGVVVENDTYAFYPHLTNSEGFYIARLRKI